jgi:hypothetical protein
VTIQEAIRHAYHLHKMWVGSGTAEKPYDLDRVHASMLQDYRYRRKKPQFAGEVRENRGQFDLLGKIRKVLA